MLLESQLEFPDTGMFQNGIDWHMMLQAKHVCNQKL